jgi:hypothetical protein
MMKKYLILLLIWVFYSCRKSPEINSNVVRLTKVEYFTESNNNLKLNSYQEYKYDSQGLLVEVHYSNSSLTYKIEYDSDKRISRILSTYLDKPQRTTTYNWTTSSIVANAILSDGGNVNYSFDLNENKLPIRKLISNRTTTASWNANGNVTEILNDIGNIDWKFIDYDSTIFHPYTTSYELQMLATLLDYDSFSINSKNWILKKSNSRFPSVISDNTEVVVEINSQGYPTLTKLTGTYNTTKYTYGQ